MQRFLLLIELFLLPAAIIAVTKLTKKFELTMLRCQLDPFILTRGHSFELNKIVGVAASMAAAAGLAITARANGMRRCMISS